MSESGNRVERRHRDAGCREFLKWHPEERTSVPYNNQERRDRTQMIELKLQVSPCHRAGICES